jgi:ubiquinone/menaquinone biosynthesis C-methylase UbiE
VPKANEIAFVKSLFADYGEDGTNLYLLNKPFRHGECLRYLNDLIRVMSLLPDPPKRVLDLGVGTGWTTMFLAKRGYHVVGQDICGDLIGVAEQVRELYGSPPATFVVQDYESMPYREEFDAAVFYDALHHAEDERAALAGVFAALRPGGVCVTLEPGAGHADAKGTQDVVEKYGVTEKDMPPEYIIAVAREIGFRSFRVYDREPYPTPRLLSDPDAPPPECPRPNASRLKVAMSYARKSLRALVKGPRVEDDEALFGWRRPAPPPNLRDSAIVWMQK